MFTDRAVRRPLIGSFLMMLSVTFAFWGVRTFIPTYVGSVAAKSGLSAPEWSALAGLVTSFMRRRRLISLGFLADAIGRKGDRDAVLRDVPSLTPVAYLWAQAIRVLLFCVGVFGFFSLGIWAWRRSGCRLFPTRMRATAVAFSFNARSSFPASAR